ncbi:MAG: hypothetical protein ANABAC_3286 [Anaerolineae bacterium]|jgi:hypothetical protein|nr:MAG: hypothetical protein ANABAC_3286 [Anaerolineae bacterium]
MDEQTQKSLWQKLHLDKPILAITEEDRHILLHLLGGEVVQVERRDLAAQLPLVGLGEFQADKTPAAEPVAPTASSPRRPHRKP